MICCILGTRAQLIKMAPVIREIERRGLALRLVFTGQHHESMDELMRDFGIESRPWRLYDGKEVTGIGRMFFWMVLCLWRCVVQKRRFFGDASGSGRVRVVLVHGDTFSTLLGAVVGKWVLRTEVAHIESGLRSFRFFEPFPEELTRLAVFRLSDFAFCPGSWACSNLSRYDLKTIDTEHNTIVDALTHVIDQPVTLPGLNQPYGVCSIHRFENIFSRQRLGQIVEMMEAVSHRYQLFFVLHPATRRRLQETGMLSQLEQNSNIRLMPRMGYTRFIQLVANSQFVVTDGGSNQEELSYLGIPTFLMRNVTERQEGRGDTMVVGSFDNHSLQTFLDELPRYRKPRKLDGIESPTRRIVDSIVSMLGTPAAAKV